MGLAPADINGSRLLVVGGTGFIGRHLCARAITRGMNVTSISLNIPDKASRIAGVNYYSSDLEASEPFDCLPSNRFDYVVAGGGYVDHTSFSNGGISVLNTHFWGICKLVTFLNRASLKRLIHIGSSDEYGCGLSPLSETTREQPFSMYSHAKLAATQFLQMMAKSERLPSVTCRLFLVYGPGQNADRFIPQIVDGCLRDTVIKTTAGEQFRDFCYIDDVIDALFKCIEMPGIDGDVFNIASGIPISIRSVVDMICSIVSAGRPNYGALPYREGESMSLFADINHAKDRLDWQPKIGLEEGLRLTISRTILDAQSDS